MMMVVNRLCVGVYLVDVLRGGCDAFKTQPWAYAGNESKMTDCHIRESREEEKNKKYKGMQHVSLKRISCK